MKKKLNNLCEQKLLPDKKYIMSITCRYNSKKKLKKILLSLYNNNNLYTR